MLTIMNLSGFGFTNFSIRSDYTGYFFELIQCKLEAMYFIAMTSENSNDHMTGLSLAVEVSSDSNGICLIIGYDGMEKGVLRTVAHP